MNLIQKLRERFARKLPPAPDYDVMQYAIPEDRSDERYTWFGFVPDQIYPYTLRRIITVRAGAAPDELIDPHSSVPNGVALSYLAMAKEISEQALYAAMIPKGDCQPWVIEERAKALNLARLWFTQALHVRMNGTPIGVHIWKDDAYRL